MQAILVDVLCDGKQQEVLQFVQGVADLVRRQHVAP